MLYLGRVKPEKYRQKVTKMMKDQLLKKEENKRKRSERRKKLNN